MLPLVAIATSLLPDLIKIIAGDKAGTVVTDVANAVKQVTGTADPATAKQAVDTNPTVASNLQAQLAQIAVTAAKQQNDEADQQRQDQLNALKQQLADVQNARTNLLTLATDRSWIAWVAPVVSFLVMIGFYALLGILIWAYKDTNISQNQLINICIGALVAAFSTVVNFWLGSSKGSQDKDQVQAAQTTEVLKTQAQQTTTALNTATVATANAATATVAAAQGGPSSRGAALPTNDNTSNFNQCLAVVFAEEGGFTDNPADHGGPTNFGITQADLKNFRGKDVTADDVRNMTKAEAQEIYRSKYWNPMQCGDLPNGIDLEVFDFGVNAGVGTSLKALQTVVGVTADGSIGPITLAAAKATDPRTVIQNFSERRLGYYRSLAQFPIFGPGWTNRTNSVEKAALKMVAPTLVA
jgi:hypothetical protein